MDALRLCRCSTTGRLVGPLGSLPVDEFTAEVDEAWVAWMASRTYPLPQGRLGNFRLVQMPGSHETLLTRPALVARKLVEAGRD